MSGVLFQHDQLQLLQSQQCITPLLACLLGMFHPQAPGAAVASPDHLQGLAEAMSAEHVLSGSRRATAQAVAAAIACNMPVLLEGPAAVGKTSLVTAIARFMPQQQVLERVNNTESTGLQVGFAVMGGLPWQPYHRG
jgi:hypothetical protein